MAELTNAQTLVITIQRPVQPTADVGAITLRICIKVLSSCVYQDDLGGGDVQCYTPLKSGPASRAIVVNWADRAVLGCPDTAVTALCKSLPNSITKEMVSYLIGSPSKMSAEWQL